MQENQDFKLFGLAFPKTGNKLFDFEIHKKSMRKKMERYGLYNCYFEEGKIDEIKGCFVVYYMICKDKIQEGEFKYVNYVDVTNQML